MAWNHRTRVVAMAIALQPTAGVFVQPNTTTDVIPISVPANNYNAITATDPTATGTIWENRRVYLGKTATGGATYPLRGPGGAAPPALNAWVPGRIFQSAGWTEIRNAAPIAGVLQAGSTTNALVLAAGESAVDNIYLGAPIQQAAIGTGFRATSLIRSYVGATKTAALAETVVAPAAGGAYTIPAYLSYVLGTLTTAPTYLSLSIWRDKKRYDIMDWRPTSLKIDVPVANQANTVFASIDFTGDGIPLPAVDDVTPPVPPALLALPLAPNKAGKFYIDGVKLGHQSVSFTEGLTVSAASNANQDAGQDGYDITAGTRTTAIDLNQMNVTDLDLEARIDNQTIVPILSTWGLGVGNRMGLLLPNNVLDPLAPGDRNGYVNLTGNTMPTDFDKSAAMSFWW